MVRAATTVADSAGSPSQHPIKEDAKNGAVKIENMATMSSSGALRRRLLAAALSLRERVSGGSAASTPEGTARLTLRFGCDFVPSGSWMLTRRGRRGAAEHDGTSQEGENEAATVLSGAARARERLTYCNSWQRRPASHMAYGTWCSNRATRTEQQTYPLCAVDRACTVSVSRRVNSWQP